MLRRPSAAVALGVLQSWYLWPPRDMEETSDEFMVPRGGLRIAVRLRGNALDLEVDEPAPAPAADQMGALARAYAEALSNSGVLRRLMSASELAALPPFAFQNLQMVGGGRAAERAREWREFVARAVRAARNAALEGIPGTETLRRSYEYLEDARASQRAAAGRGGVGETVLFNLYKAVEAVENALEGEKATIAALNVGAELKFVKRLANQTDRNERHGPKPGDVVNPPTLSEVGRAIECTVAVVRAYAKSL